MTWNETSNQWLPDVEVTEDFLALYNASYGVQYDYSKMERPPAERGEATSAADFEDGLQAQIKSGKEKKRLTKEEKMVGLLFH